MRTLALLLPLFCGGCLALGNAHVADPTVLSQIHPGETRKSAVISLLGEPESLQVVERGSVRREWWQYRYRPSAVNPLKYLMLTGFYISGIGMPDRDRLLTISFDGEDIVVAVTLLDATYRTDPAIDGLNVISKSATRVWIGQEFQFEDVAVWPDSR